MQMISYSVQLYNNLHYSIPGTEAEEYSTRFSIIWRRVIRGDADKSLARPGRKNATATKIWIYST
jgi:hypothetical protein